MMQAQITDKSSLAYQRMSWEALKKSINGLINKVNVSNIANIIHELLQENIVRGRGQLARSVLQAQNASPIFTHVYAAVVAIINSKFPQIGELMLKRLILNFRKGYRRNDKQLCLAASKFVAHLVNQNVAHEVLCLEMLTLLLERPNDDSVEVAISFLKECGLKLTEVSPRGINAIFERLRNILHESEIDKRVQYMIEVMFAIRKDGFKDHPIIPEGLDLVEEEDQFTHMLPLEDEYNPEDVLNVFKMDPNFLENEEKYKTIKRDILDEGSSDSGSGDDADGSDEDDDEEEVNEEEEDSDSKHRKKSSKKKDKGPKKSTSKKRSSEKVPPSKKQGSRHSDNNEEQEKSSHKHSSKAQRQKDCPEHTSTHDREDHRCSNKDPDRQRNQEFEDKRCDSRKDKENIKNNPHSENDRDRYRSREEKKYSSRREERSKSKERGRKETNSRAGSEDGYKNGDGRRAEKSDKESRHSDRSRDNRRTDDRRRESSPRRRR
ncbi:UNVERIFIED_CONTAM: hypothetical protein FKN15_052901 [Acipenser sinensis]